jgi:hypothetical protein
VGRGQGFGFDRSLVDVTFVGDTQRELRDMRETFWATRTEGNPQMWQNIRSVAEASASGDLVLANAILEVRTVYFA